MERFVVKRDELTGIPRAVVDAVASLRALIDIFPPPGIGLFAAGIGLGCGLGWPIRQAYGPPRAFCGPGIGVGVVAAGYGQGIVGIRFGQDRRAKKTREKIASVEMWIVSTCDTLVEKFSQVARNVTGKMEPAPSAPPQRRPWWRRSPVGRVLFIQAPQPLRLGFGFRRGNVLRCISSVTAHRR